MKKENEIREYQFTIADNVKNALIALALYLFILLVTR